MTNIGIRFDRFTIVGLAALAALPFMALSPAMAAPAKAECQAEAQSIRIAAEGASQRSASQALRTANVAEKICAEGNRREAGRKFAQAREQLDNSVQLASQR